MPPVLSNILRTFTTHVHAARSDFSSVKSQWQNPNDILSILTIIGGDIVQRAVAQLSGYPYYITPVAFSFGWVGYALNMVLGIMGEGRLVPDPDCECLLVNAKSRYVKTNRSWILGRLVRDHDKQKEKQEEWREKWKIKGQPATKEPALTVWFYNASLDIPGHRQGTPEYDWVYWSGLLVILAQLVISIIPGAVYGEWTILTVTLIGTILSLCGGALPKWRQEKWNGRRLKEGDKAVICLTRGNGYKHVIVVISEGEKQFRLEDIANARDTSAPETLWLALSLCVAQILLLLIVAGLEQHAWFLLAIGALGMAQNAIAAGLSRDLSTTGIHLNSPGEPIFGEKVIDALKGAEKEKRYVGISLLPVFFPGEILREDEVEWRDTLLRQYAEDEKKKKKEKEEKKLKEGGEQKTQSAIVSTRGESKPSTPTDK